MCSGYERGARHEPERQIMRYHWDSRWDKLKITSPLQRDKRGTAGRILWSQSGAGECNAYLLALGVLKGTQTKVNSDRVDVLQDISVGEYLHAERFGVLSMSDGDFCIKNKYQIWLTVHSAYGQKDCCWGSLQRLEFEELNWFAVRSKLRDSEVRENIGYATVNVFCVHLPVFSMGSCWFSLPYDRIPFLTYLKLWQATITFD